MAGGATFQSSRRDEEPLQVSDVPSTEVLGYCQTSLRDTIQHIEKWRFYRGY